MSLIRIRDIVQMTSELLDRNSTIKRYIFYERLKNR